MTTRNYKDALVILEKNTQKTTRAWKMHYRRVAYFHAQDLFNAQQYDEALKMFNISSKPGWNNALSAASIYWQGEIHYRQNQLPEATEAYNEFLVTPGALQSGYLNDAYYNLGYIRFKQKSYDRAVVEFRKYIDNFKKDGDSKRKADACLRAGDCYCVQSDWSQALTYYNKAIESSSADADYGLLQKGIILGVQQKPSEKIATLRRIEKRIPALAVLAEAQYEMGNTLFNDGKATESTKIMEDIIAKYPNSNFRKKALLKIGLDHFNREKRRRSAGLFQTGVGEISGQPRICRCLEIRTRHLRGCRPGPKTSWIFCAACKALISTNPSGLHVLQFGRKHGAERRLRQGGERLYQIPGKIPERRLCDQLAPLRGEVPVPKETVRRSDGGLRIRGRRQVRIIFVENALLRIGAISYSRNQYEKAIAAYERLERVTELKKTASLAQIRLLDAYAQTEAYDKTIEYADFALKSEKTTDTEREKIYLQLAKVLIWANNKRIWP